MNRRDALRVLGAVPLGVASLVRGARAPQPPRSAPNVLFVMTDDQRQDAMSAYGNAVLKTPNMDRIAAGGVRFTEAFVTNSLCAPSRASVLTGVYSHVHGVITNGGGPHYYNQPGLAEGQVTWVELLRQAGYHTGLVGKWHLRSRPTGFDEWVIFPDQGLYHDPDMISGGTHLRLRGHADDVVGDQALEFLRARPKDRPFCLLYQFKSPHRAWEPAERFAHAFDDVPIPLPRSYEDRLDADALRNAELALADMPDFRNRGVRPDLPAATRKRMNYEQLVRNYYRVLLSVDENVGRVLDFLDANGLAENTVVVYTSDNGFFLGEHGLFDKRLMYEPSIRVPLLVRHPARVKGGRVDRAHMALNVDVAPTLLELAGVPVPQHVQGRSLVPILEGKSPSWRSSFYYEYYEYPAEHCVRKHRGIRTERWKLLHFWERPEEYELFDLQADPDETRDLASLPRHRDTVRQLRAQLDELRRSLGDIDPPGPPPPSAECGKGVNTGYGPPA